MATNYSKKPRLSYGLKNAVDVMQFGKEKPIAWEKICPDATAQWMELYAKANNTTRDILLGSILPTVACLLGETTVKVDCKLRSEQVNLFVVCLSAPGSGKSPAFQNACSQPLRLYVEEQESTALFVDEFTEAGLFQQLKTSKGSKALLGKEEVSQFFEHILQGGRDKSRIDVERLIQLYDGATWVYTKADKSARQIVQNPGVSIVGYSQPQRFFPLYVKLKERRDGAVDRMLIYQPMPIRLTSQQTKDFILRLNQSPVKDLRAVYDEVYKFGHDENGPVTLTLDQAGNRAFENYVDRMAAALNKQWQENRDDEDVSKDDRHVLRLAAVMHILYDQMEKKLRSEQPSPPPTVIKKETLERAIEMTNYFAEQRKVLEQLSESTNHCADDTNSISTTVLTSPGPFVTARQVQNFYSGKKRPASSSVIEVMSNLEKDGLGRLKQVERTNAFFKCLPCNITDDSLAQYKIDRELYLQRFPERAPLNVVSKELYNKLLDNSTEKEDLDRLYLIVREV